MWKFRCRASIINAKLNAKGYTGTLADKLDKYLTARSSITGTSHDKLAKTCAGAGSITDKIHRRYAANSGGAISAGTFDADAERKFWGNNALDI